MSRISRRSFVNIMATSAAVLATPYVATGSTRPRVVVIGGSNKFSNEQAVFFINSIN